MKYALKEGKCAQFSRVILKTDSQTSSISITSYVYFLLLTCKPFRIIVQRPSETVDEMILSLTLYGRCSTIKTAQFELLIFWKREKGMTYSKPVRMLQMDFLLQKKSKIPRSYNSHETKLLAFDQLQLKEKNPKSHRKLRTKHQTPTNQKEPQTPHPHQKTSSPSNHLF